MTDVIPDAPGWLQRSARAHERWSRLWSEVNRNRIKPMHYDLMCQYCVYYSDMRDAAEKMERGKLVAEKKQVGTKADVTIERITVTPYQSIFDNSVREMSRIGQLLGLRPDTPLASVRSFDDYIDALLEDDSDGDDREDSGDDGDGEVSTDTDGALLDRGNSN